MKHNVMIVLKKHICELMQILNQYSVLDRKAFVDVADSDLVFQKAVLMSAG